MGMFFDKSGKMFRENTDEIIEELSASINRIKNNVEYWNKKYDDAVSETYKDSELQRLKKELEDLRSERYFGFEITKEEHDAIESWKDDWFKRKRGGDKYMGAAGGGFTYKFHPTGIGTSCVVIAPDGEEFEFREIG